MMNLTLFWYNTNITKRTCLYFATFSLAGVFATGVFIAAVELSFLNVVSKGLFVLFFLLAGLLHAFLYPKWMLDAKQSGRKKVLLHTIILSVLMTVSTLLVFFITAFSAMQLSVTAGCSFLLPSAIMQCLVRYNNISQQVYQPWFLPPATTPKKMVAELLNDREVIIRLKRYYFDAEETSFVIILPGGLELGKAFQFFLKKQEQTGKLQLTDHQLQPYGWKFLLLKSLGNKILDPEVTLTDNKIKQGDTILIQRIQIEKTDVAVTKKNMFHDTLYQ